MKSLNEKLAEVCGKEVYTNSQGVLQEYNPMMGNNTPIWNPTQDLNQLRECYLALSVGAKRRVSIILHEGGVTPMSVFNKPELVAQAILKAKGVE